MTKLVAILSPDGILNIVPFVDETSTFFSQATGAADGTTKAEKLSDSLAMWTAVAGKEKRLPFNQAATSILIKFRGGVDYVVGPVVFTGAVGGGAVQGLSEDMLALLKVYAAMSRVD